MLESPEMRQTQLKGKEWGTHKRTSCKPNMVRENNTGSLRTMETTGQDQRFVFIHTYQHGLVSFSVSSFQVPRNTLTVFFVLCIPFC